MSKADVIRRAAPLLIELVREYENSGSVPAESASGAADGAGSATSKAAS